jgi:hypothetical protein
MVRRFAVAGSALLCILAGCDKSLKSTSNFDGHPSGGHMTSSAQGVGISGAAVHGIPDEQLISQFARDNYGKWRADRRGWQFERGALIYQECASLRVGTADGPRYLLAMCGETEASEKDGEPGMDDEGQPGMIDIYVLKPSQGGHDLEPAVQKTDIESGHNGMPGNVTIQKFGRHLFGFAIDNYFSADGYSQDVRSIYLPLATGLVEAASHINLELDSTGSAACGESESKCENRTFHIAPLTTGGADVYPLAVTETGSHGDHAYTINFYRPRRRYAVPKVLSEGY